MRQFYGDKYYPLKMAAAPIVAIIAVLIVIFPAYLLYHGVPIENWFGAFKKVGGVVFVVAGQIILSGWFFSELAASKFKRLIACVLFGAITGLIFLILLSAISFALGHNFFQDLFTPEGFKNASLIFGLLSVLSSAIYWQGTKPEKNYL